MGMDGEGADAALPRPSSVLPASAPDDGDARRTLLELATAAAGVGTFDWDLPTGTLNWDDRLIELFGYDTASFDRTIDGFNARLHPDDAARVGAGLQQAIDTGGDLETEYRVLLPDGRTRWLAARGRALRDERGRTVRFLGAAWDITTRRQTQDRLSSILEGMAVGFIAMDGDWVVTHVNAEGERITGRPRAELVGRTLWEEFPAAVGTELEEAYRRAAGTGQTVTLEAYYPAPLDIWVEVRAVPGAEGLSLYFLDVTERRRNQERSQRATRRERLLSRITGELAGTLDAEEATSRLARLVVPALADWCVVTLVDDAEQAGSRRGLRHAGSWHADPALRQLTDTYARTRLSALTDDGVVAQALATGEPQLLASGAAGQTMGMLSPGPVQDLMATLAPDSVVVLPLPGRTGPVGLLSLANGAEAGAFTADDLTTARHVAARAGLVLDNARLYRQQRGLAEGLQRSLLTAPPEPDHVQVVVRYVPAGQAAQVGGDWYDAFMQRDGATVLVIGDVIGHDTQAAAVMGQIRTIVRTIGAADGHGPAEVLRRVDAVMETLQVGTAATIAVARLEQTPGERARGVTRLRWSNAGHPPPMVVNPDGSVLPLVGLRADLLVGVLPDARRRETEVVLDRDSVVLLYTDGLVERRDQDLDAGLDRLQRTLEDLAGSSLDDLCDELLARMLPGSLDDDVAIVAVRLHRQDELRPAEAGPNRLPPNVPDAPEVVDQPD